MYSLTINFCSWKASFTERYTVWTDAGIGSSYAAPNQPPSLIPMIAVSPSRDDWNAFMAFLFASRPSAGDQSPSFTRSLASSTNPVNISCDILPSSTVSVTFLSKFRTVLTPPVARDFDPVFQSLPSSLTCFADSYSETVSVNCLFSLEPPTMYRPSLESSPPASDTATGS